MGGWGLSSDDCLNVVWFKRDLRIQDHRVLARAAEAGPVLPLFVVEEALWTQPDMSARQWAFVEESLHHLRADLHKLGQPLVVQRGDALTVLSAIHGQHPRLLLWSHEETGNDWTYQRDKAVAAWCQARSIPWHEMQQHGTIRRIRTRNGWAKAWDETMTAPLTAAPPLRPLGGLEPGLIPTCCDLGLAPDPCPARQKGGRPNGRDCLKSFLQERGAPYRKAMSSPLAGERACSRLSPHLAWGTLSMREVAQATWERQRSLKEAGNTAMTKTWRAALHSFSGRLHWHCHFIQKLEDDPRIETHNLHRAYDDLRPLEPDQARFEAWKAGETGLPFVDACMRYLAATGWLNFRMRAMVTAVASYHLWLDWKAPGRFLARQFTDYEPGIHWPQIQMQSGTTGMNTVRVYNPVKQGHDQDPEGVFIRRWLPELNQIDSRFVHEPWKAENAGSVLGKIYPFPIIDHMEAAREARQKVWAIRKGDAFWTETRNIQTKHGSRKSGVTGARTGRRTRKSKASPDQLNLFGEGEPS